MSVKLAACRTDDLPLERFGQVMRDVVLVYLDHRPPRILFIRQLRLAAETNDGRIVCCNRNQTIEGIGFDFRVRIDCEEEFVQLGINAFGSSMSARLATRHLKCLPMTFLI